MIRAVLIGAHAQIRTKDQSKFVSLSFDIGSGKLAGMAVPEDHPLAVRKDLVGHAFEIGNATAVPSIDTETGMPVMSGSRQCHDLRRIDAASPVALNYIGRPAVVATVANLPAPAAEPAPQANNLPPQPPV